MSGKMYFLHRHFFLIIVSLSTENAAEGVNSCNTGSYKYATYEVAMLE